MVMQTLREGAVSGVLKYILFGLLLLAVVGLMIGSAFRTNYVKHSDVARIGSETINIREFDRDLRRTLTRMGLSPEEAYKLGYVHEILNSEIRSKLIRQAAQDYDIEISRKHIAEKLGKIIAPMVQEDQTPKEVLSQILRAQSMTEKQFVHAMGDEVARNILTTALQSGFAETSPGMVRDIYAYEHETRDMDYILLPNSEITQIPQPQESDLKSTYDLIKEESYAIPERRILKVVTLNDENLKNTISVSDDDLKAMYDDSIENFKKPEERSVVQVILASKDDAQAVADKARNGARLQDALLSVTKDSKGYFAEQRIQKQGLLQEIAGPVFSAQEGDIIGPVETSLGFHVLRVTKIHPPEITPFEQVKEDLRKEKIQTELADTLYQQSNDLDDMLAGGADLDEVKEKMDVKIETTPSIDKFGMDEKNKDGLIFAKGNRDIILKSGFDLMEGETSRVQEMPDGTYAAVYVQQVTPLSYKPFESVKNEIMKSWTLRKRASANQSRVLAILGDLKGGDYKNLSDYAQKNGRKVRSESDITRKSALPAPFTGDENRPIFDTPVNEYAMLATKDGFALIQVKAAHVPNLTNVKDDDLKQVETSLKSDLQSAGMSLFLEEKREKIGARINQGLLKAAYGQSQDE